MPRKTLALLVCLILVTVVLFGIALQTGKNQPQQKTSGQAKTMTSPTPDVAHTTLAMSPEVVEVASGKQESVSVMIDPSDNEVTAVQLELLYDPTMLSNVKVVTGSLFPNSIILLDKNDPATGRYTFAYGIQPNQKTITGKGTAATITFVARGVPGKQSQIIMQQSTLVTARGVAGSVLKQGSGATIAIVGSTVQGVKAKATPTKAVIKTVTVTPAAQ